MKKLCVLLGVLFILPLMALPARAASAEAGRKALCNWAKDHNLQVAQSVATTCGEVGVTLVANANIGGHSSQAQLVAEAERLREIAYEANAAWEAANIAYYTWENSHKTEDCTEYCHWVVNYDEEGLALKEAMDNAAAASYAADEAAYHAEVEAGLIDPDPCREDPTICK